ncbi:PorT family protein [Barnesiella sp. WM24]|uniref:porin family protein n=1 Tax=Barnesiella sp. WM24 TaxID=2558278 RepID=UPI001072546C|nr:porin family protein [Barnesiella sp. WM24]MDE6115444.1 PorT family protein [Muribaculum sp.]TFU93906.1 PorT family protein [Barnesiella sp. WM24]
MKAIKSLIAAFCMLAAVPYAHSQAHYVSKVSIGAKGGITMSKMSFTPSTKQSLVLGKTAGVTFKYWEERNFGLIAEINYEQRGWKENFEDAPYEYERHLDYIQIPLLTSIFFGNNTVKGFVNLGPEVGYMIGSSYTANFDVTNIGAYPDFPQLRMTDQLWMEPTKKFDYGISGGAGIEFIIKRRNIINLEARYYFGIGNIFPDDRRDTFSASRGMSIMVTVGYSYRLR